MACNNKCANCPAFSKSVFHGLDDKSLSLLTKHIETMEVERGTKFNIQGEDAEFVYCIAQGSAKVVLTTPPNKQQSIVRLTASGDLLGYRCIFSQGQFRATASALENTIACKIDKNAIFSLIDQNPSFSRELLKRMGQEIAAAENHHHSFCRKNVRERVAEALLILKSKASTVTDRGCRIDIHLTRNEMASWVGTAKETLIRCLADFKEEKLIEQAEDHLYILNVEKLIAVSNNNLGDLGRELN